MKLITSGRYAKGTRTLIGHRLTPIGTVNCRYLPPDKGILWDYTLVDVEITLPPGEGYRGYVRSRSGRARNGFSLYGERIRVCMGCYR